MGKGTKLAFEYAKHPIRVLITPNVTECETANEENTGFLFPGEQKKLRPSQTAACGHCLLL